MAEATNELFDTGITEHLQDLVLQSSDVEHFLHELAAFTAARLGEPGQKIYCGITLVRRKKSVTIASSDENARVLDDLQNTFGDGPCLTAIRESESVLVPDVHTEHRWPEYMEALKDHGVRSILGVPLGLDGEAGAGLNLYAGWANGFFRRGHQAGRELCPEGVQSIESCRSNGSSHRCSGQSEGCHGIADHHRSGRRNCHGAEPLQPGSRLQDPQECVQHA